LCNNILKISGRDIIPQADKHGHNILARLPLLATLATITVVPDAI
jgi:hypothetical protein